MIKQIAFLSLLMLIVRSIDSVSIVANNQTTLIYSQFLYSQQFITSHTTFTCTLNNLFTYKQSEHNLINNTPYQLILSGITQPTQLAISSQYGIISPTLNQSQCDNNCTLQITNNCPNPVSIFKYFDIVQISIQGMRTISYNVICNQNFGTSTFQAGQFLIVVICFIIIVLTAIYNRAWAFQTNGIEITYLYIIIYGIIQTIGGILILLAPKAAQILGDIIIWFVGGFGIIICSNQLIYKLRIQFLNKTLLNIKKYKLRILQAISSLIALAFLLAWLLSDKNWILNDIISICTIIATIKIFKVTSFKKALILYLIQVSIEILFVILIDVLERTSYEDLLLNQFNNPLEFQLPTINPVYGLKCSWLPISVTIFPGILLSYFHRFDNSRNTKIYLITSSVAFFFGALIWITITSVSTINFPFQSVTQPLMLILVVLFAYNRKQIKVLWNGKFYDPEFKNQQDHEEQTYNYQLQTKKAQINTNFLDGLRISKQQQESQSQAHYKQKKQNQQNIEPENLVNRFKSHNQTQTKNNI